MYISVAAFWAATQTTCAGSGTAGGDCWALLRESLDNFPGAGKGNLIVVGSDPSWYQNPSADMKAVVYSLLQKGCTVLGYLSVRNGSNNDLPAPDVQEAFNGWMTGYSGLTDNTGANPLSIDGVYFDMALLPGYDSTQAKARVADFRTAYPGAKVMVLAGFTTDAWVVGNTNDPNAPSPDFALLFEGSTTMYEGSYAASVDQPNTLNQPVPSWWKDPANRDRLAHTVYLASTDADWQRVVGLAVERSTRHLFVVDIDPDAWKDPNDHTKGHLGYSKLPPYWATATQWMQSYETGYVGLEPQMLLLAAHLWRTGQGFVHGGPTASGRGAPKGKYEARTISRRQPEPTSP